MKLVDLVDAVADKGYSRPTVSDFGPSMTKQSFAAQADMNNIVKQFVQPDGSVVVPPDLAAKAPVFGDVSVPFDLHKQYNVMTGQFRRFYDLPAHLVRRFVTPEAFMAFVSNPRNLPECIELGIAIPVAKDDTPPRVQAGPSSGAGPGTVSPPKEAPKPS